MDTRMAMALITTVLEGGGVGGCSGASAIVAPSSRLFSNHSALSSSNGCSSGTAMATDAHFYRTLTADGVARQSWLAIATPKHTGVIGQQQQQQQQRQQRRLEPLPVEAHSVREQRPGRRASTDLLVEGWVWRPSGPCAASVPASVFASVSASVSASASASASFFSFSLKLSCSLS